VLVLVLVLVLRRAFRPLVRPHRFRRKR